jgi:AcrR family transcriptional regulator
MPLQPLTPDRRRELTRDHLLAAAAQVFAEKGFHGATLDEVARVAGFSKGAVYSNFESKDDLFLALFKANYEREMELLGKTLASSSIPPGERLGDFVALVQAETSETPSSALLNLEFWLYAARNPEARARLAAIDDEAAAALADLLRSQRDHEGLEPLDDPERVARIIEVLFRGIGLLRVTQPDVADDRLLEQAIEFVARGLEGTAPRSPGRQRPRATSTAKKKPKERAPKGKEDTEATR